MKCSFLLTPEQDTYFSLASSTSCSASEKFRTWSPLGRGWTATERFIIGNKAGTEDRSSEAILIHHRVMQTLRW